MTDGPEERPGIWKRLGLDWVDVGGLIALAALTAGAWIEWRPAIALLVFGGILGLVVGRITFTRPPAPPENRRS